MDDLSSRTPISCAITLFSTGRSRERVSQRQFCTRTVSVEPTVPESRNSRSTLIDGVLPPASSAGGAQAIRSATPRSLGRFSSSPVSSRRVRGGPVYREAGLAHRYRCYLPARSRPLERPQLHVLDAAFVGRVSEEIVRADLVDSQAARGFDEAEDLADGVEDRPERTLGVLLSRDFEGPVQDPEFLHPEVVEGVYHEGGEGGKGFGEGKIAE